MFQQLHDMLTPGATIHLIISKVNGQLQVISTVKSEGNQMAAGTAMLQGSPDEMPDALLKVLTSKSEVVTTLQEQVAAAQIQDKKTVAKALSQSAAKTSPVSNNAIDVDVSEDDEGSDTDEYSPDQASASQPTTVASGQAPQPTFTLF